MRSTNVLNRSVRKFYTLKQKKPCLPSKRLVLNRELRLVSRLLLLIGQLYPLNHIDDTAGDNYKWQWPYRWKNWNSSKQLPKGPYKH